MRKGHPHEAGRKLPQDHGPKSSSRLASTASPENIIYLALARLPDAPRGIKGISLCLCAEISRQGRWLARPRNGVACGAIRHKMGIKASATCVKNFDEGERLARRRAAWGHARDVRYR
ncbi:protein of unknown function (plasmid) [Methylocella tundrae]|uniref:Uncharacterized protein n=1 Tax=Methylocella tundrae TaxID=227605 RepID=A0A4U8Z6W0_METTU|nr:protein of unknown function [Methylocella tundrae]